MSTTVKFTGLSPLTTKLLRARTEYIQRKGDLSIGRTVFTFRGTAEELASLLDYLIMTEIPGAGATSSDVRRLRELRRYLRAAIGELGPLDDPQFVEWASHVTITNDVDAKRDALLDLITELYSGAQEKGWGEVDEINDLAQGIGYDVNFLPAEFRAWISEALR